MAKKQNTQPKLQDALVLFKYVLNLLGSKDLVTLSRDLKDPMLEGLNEEGESLFYHALVNNLYITNISKDKLYEYDQNIVRYTREINEKRGDEKIQWKYFQYLSLLFTEIYLDRYFANREELLEDIRNFHEKEFNKCSETWHNVPRFTEEDLNKLAFWQATGSGKTLLMHVNIKQYLYYATKYNAKKINRVIILTPNEGLSRQHLDELKKSNMEASLFSKHSGTMFRGQSIEIIDINKLADKDGDKTVAVESFEDNNLVLVDEGHKGSGGEVWKNYRNMLTEGGFSFEYSATFGQAIAAAETKKRINLLEEYGKATLFDYSYRYFYNDGYGKDYRIMNMASWDDDEMLKMYLTAYLLCLYEQTLAYSRDKNISQQFLVAKPLGIFVGASVNAIRKENKRNVSDIVQILLFLQDFIDHKDTFSLYIKRLLDPTDGIKNNKGYSLFANAFKMTREGMNGREEEHARMVYDQVLKVIFNSNINGAHLHVIKQKGGDKEIGLQVGDADFFGVINVGDSDELAKLCADNGLLVESREFGKMSLFSGINQPQSTINILIGSKKFSEGWSSWRVSAMGLMNMGRSEGSEIIQLFGRGVRLKGFKYSLKRSMALDSSYEYGILPKGLQCIETLNVFGVRADYMEAFRKYLEDEGLSTDEDVYEKINVPTVNLLGDKQLKIVRLKEGYDFKKTIIVHPLDAIKTVSMIKLDWSPKVMAMVSNDNMTGYGNITPQGHLDNRHLDLLDWNRIFFAIEQMKNERSWYNMELSIDVLKQIMNSHDWYELLIPKEALQFHDYGKDVTRWEEITIALLRAYIDRAYKQEKGTWESKYMESVYITSSDPNFFKEYTIEVHRDKGNWIERLKELNEQITSGNFEEDFDIEAEWIRALRFDQHLYYPLLCLKEKDSDGKRRILVSKDKEPLIKISPAALNKGEQSFVNHVREYYNNHKDDTLKGKELYLLRNESRKGIGFFEASNFYPDFILWVNDGEKQRVTFIDPKGIRNLKGLDDSKIQLFKRLREDVQPSLEDKNIILDSYIISNTEYKDVSFWDKCPKKFTDNHVVFQSDDNYLDIMFNNILKG